MHHLLAGMLAALLGLSSGTALAQPGGGQGPASGPMMGAGPAASAAGKGMGMGGRHGAARWGSDFTPGWSLMTRQERDEHRQQMQAVKTYDECKAYHEKHHEQMAARAKERGVKLPAQPRRDPCASLKP